MSNRDRSQDLMLHVGHGIGDSLYSIKLAKEIQKRRGLTGELFLLGSPAAQRQLRGRIRDVSFIAHRGKSHKMLAASGACLVDVRSISGRMNPNIMKAWYTHNDVDPEGWQDYVDIVRDPNKEAHLEKYLNIQPGDVFYLRNINMSRGSVFKDMPIPDDGIRVIDMDTSPGYNFFDWCSVIEKASAIYSTDSGNTLLTDVLATQGGIKAKELICVCRRSSVDYIDHLYRAKWDIILPKDIKLTKKHRKYKETMPPDKQFEEDIKEKRVAFVCPGGSMTNSKNIANLLKNDLIFGTNNMAFFPDGVASVGGKIDGVFISLTRHLSKGVRKQTMGDHTGKYIFQSHARNGGYDELVDRSIASGKQCIPKCSSTWRRAQELCGHKRPTTGFYGLVYLLVRSTYPIEVYGMYEKQEGKAKLVPGYDAASNITQRPLVHHRHDFMKEASALRRLGEQGKIILKAGSGGLRD